MAAEPSAVRWIGQQAVIATPAEIDLTNAGEVRETLLTAASLGAAVLIIDMTLTRFCDSAGIQAILHARQHAIAARTQVRLAATSMIRILTLIGVDQLIPIYPTLETALAGRVDTEDSPEHADGA